MEKEFKTFNDDEQERIGDLLHEASHMTGSGDSNVLKAPAEDLLFVETIFPGFMGRLDSMNNEEG